MSEEFETDLGRYRAVALAFIQTELRGASDPVEFTKILPRTEKVFDALSAYEALLRRDVRSAISELEATFAEHGAGEWSEVWSEWQADPSNVEASIVLRESVLPECGGERYDVCAARMNRLVFWATN